MAKMFENSVLPDIKNTGKATPHQIEQLEKECDQVILSVQSTEPEIEKIARWLQEIKEVLSSVLKLNNSLTQKVAKLQSKLERVEEELADVKSHLLTVEDELAYIKSDLLTGQIVSCFERKIVEAILKGVEQTDQTVTINQLEKILNNQMSHSLPKILKTDEKKKQLRENWSRFNEIHKLDDQYYACIDKLKYQRNKTAHPNLHINEAKKKLRAASLDENDRRICMEMLKKMENMGTCTI